MQVHDGITGQNAGFSLLHHEVYCLLVIRFFTCGQELLTALIQNKNAVVLIIEIRQIGSADRLQINADKYKADSVSVYNIADNPGHAELVIAVALNEDIILFRQREPVGGAVQGNGFLINIVRSDLVQAVGPAAVIGGNLKHGCGQAAVQRQIIEITGHQHLVHHGRGWSVIELILDLDRIRSIAS